MMNNITMSDVDDNDNHNTKHAPMIKCIGGQYH